MATRVHALMSLLADTAGRMRDVRRAFTPLAVSLRADLEPLLHADVIKLPPEKARLSRTGGRCPTHGVLLRFDPYSPRAHVCPVCGRCFLEDEHYRWWIMNYQLWLAERAVHAAALHAVTDDPDAGRLARSILAACADAYLGYPNVDNVLGPTRPFFSTYLESIWTLQLAVALDLLEQRDGPDHTGDHVRERLLAPSAALIAEYDEGGSNRQVWNNAALLACGVLLGDPALERRAIEGRSGLMSHLRDGLLGDGSWYEGENYHQFAHRGLWYGVTMAEQRGAALPADLTARFQEAFVVPFLTALPDFTFPARRDSQYAVSLRQWRYAESCELGLARADDARLTSALRELYRSDAPGGDTGRARSTAEAERNEPPARLSRESLGWKSLLLARADDLVDAPSTPARSVHLAQQGFAVFRRREGEVYVALDYGTSGGGHGHPDRLNLWLVDGSARFLEDVGTGSYVERALFWYRSTWAHNAPLVNGQSQPYGAGVLRAYDEQGDVGWIQAEFEIVPGRARMVRTVVVCEDYLVDEVRWSSADAITVELPWHLDATVSPDRPWRPTSIGAQTSAAEFLDEVVEAAGTPLDAIAATSDGRQLLGWLATEPSHTWRRARGPAPPGHGEPRAFVWVRVGAREGRIRSTWSWGEAVQGVSPRGEVWRVRRFAGGSDDHSSTPEGWRIERQHEVSQTVRCLGGRVAQAERTRSGDSGSHASLPRHIVTAQRPFVLELGERHYRRSERPWAQAGAPEATLRVAATRDTVDVDVHVRKADPVFAPARADNPLDNEDPDVNSDGLQLYLDLPDAQAFGHWLLVPVPGEAGQVRVKLRQEGGAVPLLQASWRLTPDGYSIRCSWPRGSQGLGIDRYFLLNVVINEISRDRERRRGQLVATGARDEWVYLRGDREDPRHMLGFEIRDG